MDCEKYRQLISSALDGEVSSDETRELEQHLAGCEACREFKAELEEIHGLSLKRAPASMPTELEQGILEKVPGQGSYQKARIRRPNSGYYRIPKIAVWAAAAVIVGLLFTSLFQPFRTATQAQRQASLTAKNEISQKVVLSDRDIVSQYTINNATIKLPKGG